MQAVGKVWGLDLTLLEKPGFSLHEIRFKEGGVCSEHMHAHRYNAFYVLAGHLAVRTWNGRPEPDLITLTPGAMTIVPPGVYHQFEGKTNGVALEIYWTDGPDGGDIDRRTQGFKHMPLAEANATVN